MENLPILKGKMHDQVIVPASKSYANRALILGSIIERPFSISGLSEATDVTNLLNALKAVGLKIDFNDDKITIVNSFPQCEIDKGVLEIHVGEGGTTARFLATLLMLGKRKYLLRLGHRLKSRPWDELLRIGKTYGAYVDLQDDKLILQGPLRLSESTQVDCLTTTQFATALQLLTSKTKSQVIPVNMNSSQSYWDLTVHLSEKLPGKSSFSLPGDWSSASYAMAFAALNHEIFFPGFLVDKFQADSKLFEILRSLEAIEQCHSGIKVFPSRISRDIEFDVSDCLDLVPTLIFLLSHISGDHKLRGVQNLVHKESDRLQESLRLLSLFNKKASSDGLDLFIKGDNNRECKQMNLLFPDDHRMVMAGTLFLLHHNGGVISPADAVKKSYPNFFNLICS
jgi:3-phosphoshikimate 1-carboxyvinyltransferase